MKTSERTFDSKGLKSNRNIGGAENFSMNAAMVNTFRKQCLTHISHELLWATNVILSRLSETKGEVVDSCEVHPSFNIVMLTLDCASRFRIEDGLANGGRVLSKEFVDLLVQGVLVLRVNDLNPADLSGFGARNNGVKHGGQRSETDASRDEDDWGTRLVQEEVSKGECDFDDITFAETVMQKIGQATRMFLINSAAFSPNRDAEVARIWSVGQRIPVWMN